MIADNARTVAARDKAYSHLLEVQKGERPNCNMYRFRFIQRYYFIGENPYNFEELVQVSTKYLNEQICTGRYSGTFKHGEYSIWTYDIREGNLTNIGSMYD